MEKDTEIGGRSHKNFWRGKPNTWLWIILIIVVGTAIAFAVVRYNMSVATQLQQTEQENNARVNAVEQQNNQLQANQNQLQQENNQLQMNQLRQQCETGCTSHTPLFSQNYWE